nr:MAG TPA: hypothetical protein [Caudoviricetes sp.]
MVNNRSMSTMFEAASAATSTEDIGNPVHHGTRGKLEEHIRKIAGYDYVYAETAFLLIFADTSDPMKMWNEYETRVLKRIKNETKDEKWHITEQIPLENIELIKQDIGPNPLYMCMTVHECNSTGQRFNLYHIMVDIRKQAAKEEAVSARSLTKKGRGKKLSTS